MKLHAGYPNYRTRSKEYELKRKGDSMKTEIRDLGI